MTPTSPFDQADPKAYHASRSTEALPDPLPADPLPTFARWFREAHEKKVQANPNAMTVATADAQGNVQARILLCKGLDERDGFVVFYTNYDSRKGDAIAQNPRGAIVFHWDALDRQVRLEGPIVRSPSEESDAYYASRPWESRVGAWASLQSRPVASREQLIANVRTAMARLGLPPEGPGPGVKVEIPRPPNWGGYRLFARRVELWVAGTGRIHDRGVWERDLEPRGAHAFAGGPWRALRLQP